MLSSIIYSLVGRYRSDVVNILIRCGVEVNYNFSGTYSQHKFIFLIDKWGLRQSIK